MNSFVKRQSESNQFFLLAGPCAIEGEDMALRIAEHIVALTDKLKIPYVFKGSFKKLTAAELTVLLELGMKKH